MVYNVLLAFCSALIRLINGQKGDMIDVLRSISTNVSVAVSHVDNNMVVVSCTVALASAVLAGSRFH